MALSTVEKEIYEQLKNGRSPTTVVVGKSGSGKTWIAKKLSVIATKNGLFDSVIWLFLNRNYDKMSVYKSIANQLSLFCKQYEFGDGDNMDIMELNEEDDLEKLEKMITDALKGKKFLLVLDDEGKKMKKEKIDGMLPFSLLISGKVLITTVNKDGSHIVVNKDGSRDVMDPKVIEVGSLSKEESMSLLRRGAGSKAFEFPEVETLVERFMDQPAAIIVTAKALSYFYKSNSGVGTMESALKEVLNDEQLNSIKLRIKSIKLLCHAHEMFPSRILVDCAWGGSHFFRERGSVHYKELIAYWILEGYLSHIDSIEEAYKEGYRVLMDLIDCQLLKKEEDDYIIMEKSEEADYIVQMLGLDNRHRSGFDGTTSLGLADFKDGKWGGLGKVTLADGMIRTPQKGQEISMAMLDGNGMCKEVLNNFCQSKPQLQLLAILNPTLESLAQAFNISLASHPPPISQPPVMSCCMTNLDILVLRGCDFLVDIGHIRELSKLSVLEISGASSLAKIPPDIFEKMTKLQSLHLSSLQIEKLPASFYKLTDLQRLLFKKCPNLDELGRLEKCDKIVVLNLSGATSLKVFPYRNLEQMPKLRTLDLSNTNISNLIKIGRIEHLTHISLRGCPHVDRIPSIASLPSLQVLDISGAKNFTEIHDKSFANNHALNILDLSGTQIRKLPSSVGNPRHLYLRGCSSLEKLPFMESLKNLEALDLSDASNVKIEEKFFESLTKLRLLNLSKTNIESLPYLSNHSELRQLLLSHCPSLYELPQLKNLTKLEVLDLSGCTLLKEIQTESFDQMTCLQRLILSETQFEYLPSLSNIITLRVLLLSSCTRLKVLLSMESLSRLEELNLSSVTCLGETGAADFLKNMVHLQKLDLSESNLKKLPSMSNLGSLSQLLLRGCNQLEEVPDLQHLTRLEVLDLSGTAISQLPHLQDLMKLEVLDLSGTAISQLPSLNNLTNLHQLLLRDCPYLDLLFRHEMHGQSGAIPKQLDLPNMVNNLGAQSKKINGREEEEVKEYHWHISNLPEMITDSDIPFTSVSGSTFLKLLETNSSVRQLLEKTPLLRETGLKQFHLFVRPVDKQNSGGIRCYRGVRGIYFQARCFPNFNEQGISLELCGFHDFPQGIDDVLSSAEYVFLFDNIFIKELYDLGAQNIKHMKGCWIERCENMQSVIHSKEEGDISELWKNLEMLWLSNLHNLTSMYSGNLQHQGFQSLKQLYLDCCPRISTLFSSSHLPKNLEILHIKFCDNLETVVENSTSEDCMLPELRNLHNLTSMYSGNLQHQGFQSLKQLYLDCCPRLSSLFSSSHLPENLEILQIKFCDSLESVVKNSTSENCTLPELRKLNLFGLPKLKSIGAALPSFCDRNVRDCPQLQSKF